MPATRKRAYKGARLRATKVFATNLIILVGLGAGACGGSDDNGGGGGAAGAGASSGSGGSTGGADAGVGGVGGTGATGGCTSSVQCDDGKSCTIDTCNAGVCTSTIGPALGATACPAGQYCTVKDGCVQAPACATDQDCIDAWKGDACKTNPHCEPSSSVCTFEVLDKDHDGDPPQVCGGGDCDDADPDRFTGNDEVCDAKDNDCNGAIDEGSLCDSVSKCISGTCACNPANLCRNGNWFNCVDFQSDTAHCGSCNTACKPGQACVNGSCTCAAPKTDCGSTCVDLSNDPSHCGTCSIVCNVQVGSCKSGKCTCEGSYAGLTYCSGSCADLKSDAKNCGTCGKTCPSGSCTNGACDVCPTGKTLCAGACVWLDDDKTNCGACGKVCTGSCPSCAWGICGNNGCAGAGGI